jgi:alcohol dehydrogenase
MAVFPFEYEPATRLIFGPGRIQELGALARLLGGRRALVVSDPGIVAAGHTARGVDSLTTSGVECQIFDQVHENPTSDDVERGVEAARAFCPNLLVGLGGGSSMDCAKGINFVYSCGGRIQDYWGVGKATAPLLPMIAVPTTAGTGSEMQSFALISDAKTHVKMACGDRRAACRMALLDPELTLTQPRHVTALTGIDAVAHAVESYVTTRRNPLSLCFAREAWRRLEASFLRVLSEPNDLQARAGMQIGAALAGMAIEHSMLGAAHALANPLTAVFGVPHGHAVALMLPHVVRYNGAEVSHWYEELLWSSAATNGAPRPGDGPDGLAHFITELTRSAGLPTRLSEIGVEAVRLPELARSAATQWTARFNPRTVNEPELLRLYELAL